MNVTPCKGQDCGQPIGFLRIAATGQVMPVDPTPVVEWLAVNRASGWGPRVTLVREISDGRGEVVTGQRGVVPAEAPADALRRATEGLTQVTGYPVHWASCPAHNQFRTKPRRAAPTPGEPVGRRTRET